MARFDVLDRWGVHLGSIYIYIYIETTDIGVCAIGPLNPLYPLKLRALGARLWTSDISTRPVHSGVRGAGCERPNHP